MVNQSMYCQITNNPSMCPGDITKIKQHNTLIRLDKGKTALRTLHMALPRILNRMPAWTHTRSSLSKRSRSFSLDVITFTMRICNVASACASSLTNTRSRCLATLRNHFEASTSTRSQI